MKVLHNTRLSDGVSGENGEQNNGDMTIMIKLTSGMMNLMITMMNEIDDGDKDEVDDEENDITHCE